MKAEKYLATAILFSVMVLAAGCENCFECPEPSPPEPLANTKWKLVGFVDTETGEIEKLEPRDSHNSYTLTFTTDTKAEVRAFLMHAELIELDLYRLGEYEYPDDYSFSSREDETFLKALYNYNTKSYTVISGKLMFINNAEKYYLLFEPYDKVVADEKEFVKNQIMGQWKLLEVSIYINYQPYEVIDFSEENIIYDFQDNNKLIITGPVPGDLPVFDDFREGEHYYRYRLLAVCSVCYPAENLIVSDPELTWGVEYYCKIPMDRKTMEISGSKNVGGVMNENGLLIGSDYIEFDMSFIRIK